MDKQYMAVVFNIFEITTPYNITKILSNPFITVILKSSDKLI
jgi:hypothetical protein